MPASLKNIFITGAGGMLGSDLVRALQGTFHLLGAGVTPAPHLTIPYLQIDLSDPNVAAKAAGSFHPQIIFHCAALTDVDAYELRPEELLRSNAQLIESIVKTANQTGAFLIFFSTDYVFDGAKTGEYIESDHLGPISVYGQSKAEAETYIKENADRYAIFRISWLYGVYGKSFPRTIWQKAKTQTHFKVVSDQIGRPTFTRDVAGAFKQLLTQTADPLEKMNGQIFHLGNTGTTTWADLAKFVLAQSKAEASVETISSADLNRAAKRPKNSVLALDKAEKVLGLRLRDWQPAVTEFLREIEKE